MSLDYKVVDIETSMLSPIGGASSPHHPDNFIVKVGMKSNLSNDVCVYDGHVPLFLAPLLVGHNIAFDLLHMLRAKTINVGQLDNACLWDTQLAEYIITGQRSKFASLDELSDKYGGVPKNTEIADKYFKKGLGAEHVPLELLVPYLEDDVRNTERVFLEQVSIALDMKLLPLIRSQMEALLATTLASHYGICVDKKVLTDGALKTRAYCTLQAMTFDNYFASRLPYVEWRPDINSHKQVATALFGGKVVIVERKQEGFYKNGNPKYVKVPKNITIPPIFIAPEDANATKDGLPSTDERTLAALKAELAAGVQASTSLEREMLDALIEYREHSKQLTTYWESIDKLTFPDGFIHPQFNHVNTVTGRLSSSQPNMQNITNGEIKRAFKSRWGTDGVLLEVDYKQLEMVELAALSKDKQLLDDIMHGRDMHKELFRSMYGREMKLEERKAFKRCSFALVYGAGATGIAEQGGITKTEAKQFIDTFYTRYSGVKAWHDQLIEEAKIARVVSCAHTKEGYPAGECVFSNPLTKRRYWFTEYDAPDFLKRQGTITSFSPTELKNYQVQGGATGDKVPLMVGYVYRVLRNSDILKDRCFLINTVHDSLLFDVHKSVQHDAVMTVCSTLSNLRRVFEETFNCRGELPLPYDVEGSVGSNWLEMKPI